MTKRRRSDVELGLGWTTLNADVCWEDYHGLWAKKIKGEDIGEIWYVIQWTNLADAMGERDLKESGLGQYEVAVKRLDLSNTKVGVRRAVKSCGLEKEHLEQIERHGHSFSRWDRHFIFTLVEACVSYGLGAPMWEKIRDRWPVKLRDEAVREAESLMRSETDGDGEEVTRRLDRVVNKIGSTAEEFGRGDLDAAIERIQQKRDRTTKENLLLQLHGVRAHYPDPEKGAK